MSMEVVARSGAGAALAIPEALKGKWDFEGDATDILIPKILLAQSTSKAVQDEKVTFGQLYKSSTLEILGGKDKPVAVIPLYHTKKWVVLKKVGSKFEFAAIEPYTEENSNKPWEWTQGGHEWKREKTLNFFVLLPVEINRDADARLQYHKTGEIPDTDASLLPCALSFKSTSYKAGKVLVTHFAKASDFGMPAFVNFFNLTTVKETNDRGTFYTLEVSRGGKTDPGHLAACSKWRQIVACQPVKVDDSDEVQTAANAAEAAAFEV